MQKDLEIKRLLLKERKRQKEHIELIASENFASKEVRDLCGSILTNKYAEGYSGKRYYSGCQYIDEIENLTIARACKLFGARYANVQPHSGSSANMAVYRALLNHGDKILGMSLDAGGHLTHGYHLSFSGQDYQTYSYGVNKDTELIDYDEVERLAIAIKPKLIIAGASAYPRFIDFKRFRAIADHVHAYLMVDMAHIAGLVAANLHPNPLPYADVVTSTTHKTLRGPRGGIILTNSEELIKKINKAVFPGIQGGPLENIIAAKGVAFYEAMQPEFKSYQEQVVKNAKALANKLIELGFRVISNGTDNHLLIIDLRNKNITGKETEILLDKINITINKNSIPNDPLPPLKTSGIRLGTPAMTTRGFLEKEFEEVAEIINLAIMHKDQPNIIKTLKQRVKNITKRFPLC